MTEHAKTMNTAAAKTATQTKTAKTSTSTSTTRKRAVRRKTTASATAAASATASARTTSSEFGRVAIFDITPHGETTPRVELGEQFHVSAQLAAEQGLTLAATAIVRNPRGKETMRRTMICTNPGLSRWETDVQAGEPSDARPWQSGWSAVKRQLGEWTVSIEAWLDPYATWLKQAHHAIDTREDVENALDAGTALLRRWASTRDAHLTAGERSTLKKAADTLADRQLSVAERFSAATIDEVTALHTAKPLRDGVSDSEPRVFRVERPASSFTAWYDFFPRSEGATDDDAAGFTRPGTLATAVSGLERAAAEGFDTVCLPPISPIGVTGRRGRNGAVHAGAHDPGSPYAVGSAEGAADSVDPTLGTMDDVRAFTAKAHELGLEVALDVSLFVSPDNPWIVEHPQWVRRKADGTPTDPLDPQSERKDMLPLDFDADPDGIVKAIVHTLDVWVKAGVTAFRAVEPYRWPAQAWQRIIEQTHHTHPEVLFLAESFTAPAMMGALSRAGFTQSDCYFPWRNTKRELEEYLFEANSDAAYTQHDTFWPSTHRILTDYLRDNGIAGYAIRAVLAATGVPSWGIASGYELVENKQQPGTQMPEDPEEYEIRVRDWSQAGKYGIAELLTSLNAIRKRHPAVRSYHNLTILDSPDSNILAFARHTPAELTADGKPDTLIVVVNLDGHEAHQSMIRLDPTAFGLPAGEPFTVVDELTGRTFTWTNDNYVSLAPWADVAHVLSVKR
ncbi:maltotransferase domain-containing protein [Bifidobacterium boum]|uniref:maltotransferase domain-containing protein n=1 Tax=Bifidobacterium boum TaxID=78343 RepID=UPI003F92DA1C